MENLKRVINKIIDLGYQYEFRPHVNSHVFRNENEIISIAECENEKETINKLEKTVEFIKNFNGSLLDNFIKKVVDTGYQYEWNETTGQHIFKNESEDVTIYDYEDIYETIEKIKEVFDLY